MPQKAVLVGMLHSGVWWGAVCCPGAPHRSSPNSRSGAENTVTSILSAMMELGLPSSVPHPHGYCGLQFSASYLLVLVVGGWVHSSLELVWGKGVQKSPLCFKRSTYNIFSTRPNILKLSLGTISCYCWHLLPDSFSLLPSCCLQMDQKAVQIIRTSSAKLLVLAKSRLLSFSIVKTFAWSLECLTLTPACSN